MLTNIRRKVTIGLSTAAIAALVTAGTTAYTFNNSETSAKAATVTSDSNTPPEKPDGAPPSGGPGNASGSGIGAPPSGEPGNGQAPSGGPGGQGGQSQAPTEYSAKTTYSKSVTTKNKKYTSTGTDENAVLVKGGTVKLNNAKITRKSSSSTGGDSSSFYGTGASLLTTDGTTIVNGGSIYSNAAGGAGAFSYGDGTTYLYNTKITTKQGTSGGVHVAGGGTLYGWNLKVNTAGESSAAIRSDRGGGTMRINGGTYTTTGTGSPAIYSTADIAVNKAKLTAKNSEGVCIEGANSVNLFNSKLTSNMPKTAQNENLVWSVILYQSMSGDSEIGNSVFNMSGGSIKSNGGIFYTTNTESNFTIKNVKITSTDPDGFLLRCTGNSNGRGWGTSGSNGADCNFTAIDQDMRGNIVWDSTSKLDFYMTDGSTLKGAITDDESDAGSSTGDGYANVYIDKSSVWTVTGDSTVTNLYNAGTIKDSDGKSVTIISNGKTVVKGSGKYTITVTGTYSTKADTSGASSITKWSDYKVSKK